MLLKPGGGRAKEQSKETCLSMEDEDLELEYQLPLLVIRQYFSNSNYAQISIYI
jgi:hypothetical protein